MKTIRVEEAVMVDQVRRVGSWMVVLALSGALAACGGSDHKKKALVAELFSAPVSCAPRDGASPQWLALRGKVEGVSPTWLLRGELEVAGCTEPRWSKLLEAQAWSEQSNALESAALPIRCE